MRLLEDEKMHLWLAQLQLEYHEAWKKSTWMILIAKENKTEKMRNVDGMCVFFFWCVCVFLVDSYIGSIDSCLMDL